MSLASLPAPLPPGERVLWQGRPSWQALARDALHVRGLAAYSVLLVASVAGAAAWRGAGASAVVLDAAYSALFASVPLAVVVAYAWLSARAARYMITDRRVVMRVGAALPMTINLPFARIASAGLTLRGGTGEIRLKLVARDGLAATMLWPHAPFGRAEPVLRGLVDAERAGRVLSEALAISVGASVPTSQGLAKVSTLMDSNGVSHGADAVAA